MKRRVWAASVLALALALTACGGDDASGGDFDQAAAETDIRETIATFLDTSVAPEDKVDELEFGDELLETLQAGSDANSGISTTAEVTEIEFAEDNRQANVKYTITVNEDAEIPQAGIVVNVDGDWKLSAHTYCELLAQGGGSCPEGVAEKSAAEVQL